MCAHYDVRGLFTSLLNHSVQFFPIGTLPYTSVWVCRANGELRIAALETALQQVYADISPCTTTACDGFFKLVLSNPTALKRLSAATLALKDAAVTPKEAATESKTNSQMDNDAGFATLDV